MQSFLKLHSVRLSQASQVSSVVSSVESVECTAGLRVKRTWRDSELLHTLTPSPSFHHVPSLMPAPFAGDGGISIAAGIIIGLLASCVQSLGLTIQRKSHVLNQALPDNLQRVEHRRP